MSLNLLGFLVCFFLSQQHRWEVRSMKTCNDDFSYSLLSRPRWNQDKKHNIYILISQHAHTYRVFNLEYLVHLALKSCYLDVTYLILRVLYFQCQTRQNQCYAYFRFSEQTWCSEHDFMKHQPIILQYSYSQSQIFSNITRLSHQKLILASVLICDFSRRSPCLLSLSSRSYRT